MYLFDFTMPPAGVIDLMVEPVEWTEQVIEVYGTSDRDADPTRLAELIEAGVAWPLTNAWIHVQWHADPQDARWPWRTISTTGFGEKHCGRLRVPAIPLRAKISAPRHAPATVPLGEGKDPQTTVVFLVPDQD